jgi:predicted ATPase
MLLYTLGGLALQGTSFSQTKPLLLLAYLAIEGPRERRHLWELFWSQAADPANSLRVALHALNQGAPGALEADGMCLTTRVQTDVQALLEAMDQDTPEKVLTLYGGPFLEGANLTDLGAELEEWVYGTREYLAKRVREAYLSSAESSLLEGHAGSARTYAGNAYRLRSAPALEPEEIERLHTLFVAVRSPLAAAIRREAEEVGLTLPTPARLAGVKRSGGTGWAPIHNLPAPGSSFVGRDLELLEIAKLLTQSDCRLLTLTGPGGMGKTRLALQAAWERLNEGDFGGGVFFVPLDAVGSPEQIPSRVVEALGLNVQGQEDLLASLVEYVGDGSILLVLDNLEHLLAGTGFISELLKRCGNLKVVTTSRQRLDLTDEWVLLIEGLAVAAKPADKDILHQDAVQLFIKRAKRARLSFSLTPEDLRDVLEICQLVQGSPLGIELAATWVRVLSCREIAREIRGNLDFLTVHTHDVVERHRSIRAVFESAWKLLSAKEQNVLGALSVFRGGFRREAAGEVVGATIPVLASLVDKSLLQVTDGGRYDRHPLLYGYISEKLEGAHRAEPQRRHAAHFLALAEELNTKLKEPKNAVVLNLLEEEHENLRTALHWALAYDGVTALRLAGALGRFWEIRGHLNEGRGHLESALALPCEAPVAIRARALTVLGRLIQLQGDVVQAESLFEKAFRLWREEEDTLGIAETLNRLGHTAIEKDDYISAERLFEEALELYQQQADTEGIATLLNNLGEAARCQHDFDRASTLYEESLALYRETGDIRCKAIVLGNLGSVARRLGEHGRAKNLLMESLTLRYELREEIGLAYCFTGLAGVASDTKHYRHAGQLLGIVATLLEKTRHQMDAVDRMDNESVLNTVRTQLGLTAFTTAWQEGYEMTLEQAIDFSQSLAKLA